VFKKREELVKESIEKAEQSEKALEKAKEQEKEIIKKARLTGDDIIKEAKEQSDEIIKQAEISAKDRADKMINDAKGQITLETAQAQEELNKYVLRLSMDMLKRTLSNVFTEKEQSEIIDKAMKEMQKLPN
jgi:F-type H+-transporting ATPase subunit b